MTSRWEGRTLVGEGTQPSASGPSQTVREVLAFGADGQTLTIDVTTTGPGGSSEFSCLHKNTGGGALLELANALQGAFTMSRWPWSPAGDAIHRHHFCLGSPQQADRAATWSPAVIRNDRNTD